MTRLLLAMTFATTAPLFAQPPNIPTPKTFPPDAATLKTITDQTAELKTAVAELAKTTKTPNILAEVEVFHKAAEWVVTHGEWYTDKTAKQTLDVLDAGLKRAAAMKEPKTPWVETRDKPIALGYKSRVDGSMQPYSLQFPADFDGKKRYRLDVVLHGRDATLTEVKFLHGKEFAKAGKAPDHFVLEVYGRGNNAYRWAGEADVFEAISAARGLVELRTTRTGGIDEQRIVLRGFSMGGAGTWHIGLHHPFTFAVLGPGAGFTTTRDYIGAAKFGKQPDYIEKCLHIYDAVDYAENVFNVPVVAYSGEKDKQKLAADLIEAKLKDFKEPHSFTHLVAPGLEHKQPPEWLAKLEAEYQKHLKAPRPDTPERVRLVTYTPRYGIGSWVNVVVQEKQYERSTIDATFGAGDVAVRSQNVRKMTVTPLLTDGIKSLTVDGQRIALIDRLPRSVVLVKMDGKWKESAEQLDLIKRAGSQGPIDDAFRSEFHVRSPFEPAWFEATGTFATARYLEFDRNWVKHFRGKLPAHDPLDPGRGHQVLFGDPASNPEIAKLLPKLPIKWTKDELVVNGVKYDPKTHVPVLIYPHPERPGKYVVINSGHTFREADLKGTNALLYPRLGDWAVLKPKPTKDDPAGFEVVAAGLFDENWQFEKK
jgi:hypothetical protein